MVTQIDGGSITGGYNLWLATWIFVKKVLTSWAQVPALVPTTGWPILGNWGEKVKFWQFGTIAIGGTEVDLNVWKGTKQQLYDWLKFKGTVTDKFTITGAVTPALAGVTITLSGLATVTGMQGQFTLANVLAGTTGSLTPTMLGYTFEPVSIPINANANITAANFVATKDEGGQPPVDPVGFQAALDAMEARLLAAINKKRKFTED